MTLDLSLEAIEADLITAERGGYLGEIALARAQVRATLLASSHRLGTAVPEPGTDPGAAWLPLPKQAGPADIQIAVSPYGDSYAVPATATQADRETAAARLLQIPLEVLQLALHFRERHLVLEAPGEVELGFDEPDALALDIETDDEVDADFFAEARKARGEK